MRQQLTEQQKKSIIEAVEKFDGNKTHAAKHLGLHRQVIIDVCKELGQYCEKCNMKSECDVSENGDNRTVSYVSDKIIRTEKEAIEYAEVDLSIWHVEKWECSGWTVPMKISMGFDKNGKKRPDKPIVKQQWKVKLYLKRIFPKAFIEASQILFDRLSKKSPRYQTPAFSISKNHMMVFDPYDVHFGKLAWAPETSSEYNIGIARESLISSAKTFVDRCKAFPLDMVVIFIGQDFFHVDNNFNTTTAGTPQDVDGRYAQIIVAGEEAMIESVEIFRKISLVKLYTIPGNHDCLSSFHLTRTLKAYFRNSENVIVDDSPCPRKYVRYGTNLIGCTHGNEEKHSDLPIIMAVERNDFGSATCREWHLGHLHKSKRTQTTNVDQFNGVTVRILQSLSGTDAWHHRKGYVGGTRAAEALVYSKDGGHEATFVARAKDFRS